MIGLRLECSYCCDCVQITALEDPYGVCGTQSLNHYDASTPYTVARCEMDCLVENFVYECGCKDEYMPGTE